MDDPRAELLVVTRKLIERLRWLERGGVTAVPFAAPRVAKKVVARAPVTAQLLPQGGGAERLALVRTDLGDCTRCKLSAGRETIVFGTGSPDAALMFVGEGPGAEEDKTGEPFVGEAGQLLTKMIEAMGFARGDVYICNIVKCRPPGNRNPEPDEIAACEPFLRAQIAAVRPRVLVCLGKFAAQTLLRNESPISKMRGTFGAYEGIPLMPTFHPAFLLRNPSAKREVWSDLQQVMGELDKLGVPRPRVAR